MKLFVNRFIALVIDSLLIGIPVGIIDRNPAKNKGLGIMLDRQSVKAIMIGQLRNITGNITRNRAVRCRS